MHRLLIALSFHLGRANPADPWFSPDKLQHFLGSAFVQSVSYGALRGTGVRHGPALAGASVVTLAAGAGKELWDRAGHGDPSLRDLTWDIAGAATASVILSQTAR